MNMPLDYNFGKLPPQAIEVEEAVLGALILEAKAIYENQVKPEWFYKDSNQIILQEIIKLSTQGNKIDLVTVISSLKNSGELEKIGGPPEITRIIRNVASAGHIQQHISIVYEKYLRREIIRLSSEVQSMAYDESNETEDLLQKLQGSTLGVMDFNQNSIRDFKYASELVKARIKANEQTQTVTGIPTGFSKLDKFTGGWQKTDLVVVAGETSQGKTSLVMNFALNAAIKGFSGVVYSLEMSLVQLAARLISSYVKISSKRILFDRLASFEKEQVNSGIFKLANIPLYTDDNVNNSLESILLSIRRMKIKYNINYAVVDYIQNVREHSGKNEEGSLSATVKALKNIAKELEITIFAVSQLSRNKERPAPTINRLRGSGQIEETADIIILVYRPEHYNLPTFPEPFENIESHGKALLNIAKGRNIGTGAIITDFDKTTTSFTDQSDNYAPVNYNEPTIEYIQPNTRFGEDTPF
jgi:replicative DNA helicase